ncbi:hypothetical protein Tco_1119917, partial [Tanacetum coccineum]
MSRALRSVGSGEAVSYEKELWVRWWDQEVGCEKGEMVDRDMTMEEYDQYETEQALGNGKVFHWETATYSKI